MIGIGVCQKRWVGARVVIGPNHVARMAISPLGFTTKQDLLETSDILIGALQHLHSGLNLFLNHLEDYVTLFLRARIHNRGK